MEVVRLEGHAFSPEDVALARDMYLLQVSALTGHIWKWVFVIILNDVIYLEILFLQLCSGIDENTVGACAQLVFAPIDESFADDAPLLASGFRVIPLDSKAAMVKFQLTAINYCRNIYHEMQKKEKGVLVKHIRFHIKKKSQEFM